MKALRDDQIIRLKRMVEHQIDCAEGHNDKKHRANFAQALKRIMHEMRKRELL